MVRMGNSCVYQSTAWFLTAVYIEEDSRRLIFNTRFNEERK